MSIHNKIEKQKQQPTSILISMTGESRWINKAFARILFAQLVGRREFLDSPRMDLKVWDSQLVPLMDVKLRTKCEST